MKPLRPVMSAVLLSIALGCDDDPESELMGVLNSNSGIEWISTRKEPGFKSVLHAVIQDPQGRIIAAGLSAPIGGSDSQILVTRFLSNGEPDPLFASNGNFLHGANAEAHGIAMDSQGIVYVTGALEGDMFVLRLDPQGQLLPFPGVPNGVFTHHGAGGGNGDDAAHSIQIDLSGRIIVTGESRGANLKVQRVVWRINAGALDSSFNGTGYVTSSDPMGARGYSVALQADGRIVVAGEANSMATLWRFNSDGSPGGIATLSDSVFRSVAIDSSGRIIVSGERSTDKKIVVCAFESSLAPDASFGNQGVSALQFGNGATSAAACVDFQGHIYTEGSRLNAQGTFDLFVARLNSDGSLDTTFGTAGVITVERAQAKGMALDPGMVIGVGSTLDGSVAHWLVVKMKI